MRDPPQNSPSQEYFRRQHAQQQIREIKENLDILDYVKNQGYEVESHGAQKYHLKLHDSLVLNVEKQRFEWYSQQKYGDILSLAQLDLSSGAEIRSLSEARRYLFQMLHVPSQHISRPVLSTPQKTKTRPKLEVPTPDPTKWNRLYAYLLHQRGISPSVFHWLKDKGLIYPDERGNLVYLGRDENGKDNYVAKKGTLTGSHFRYVDPGSDFNSRCSWNLDSKPKTVFVTEAAVDAWSLMSFFADSGKDFTQYGYISLECCYGGPLIHHLQKNLQIETVYLCQDNDEAGIRSRKECRQLLETAGIQINTIDRFPHYGKDWNEQLQNKRMEERITVIDMQNEQQAQQALRVVMDGSRITAQAVISCMRMVTQYAQTPHHGRQSIKHLNLQGRQLSSIPIEDPQLQAIKRQLKSYSVDFSIMREKQPDGKTDKTSLWFKSQDQERICTALENVIADMARDPHAADIEKKTLSDVCWEAECTAQMLNAEKAASFADRGLVR